MKIGKVIGIGSAVLVGGYLICNTLCWAQVGFGYAARNYSENYMLGLGVIDSVKYALTTVGVESDANWSIVKSNIRKIFR